LIEVMSPSLSVSASLNESPAFLTCRVADKIKDNLKIIAVI